MGLIQQLDATTSYREQIERELAALVPVPPAPAGHAEKRGAVCAGCGTFNDTDARFCKQCGTSLRF